MSLTIAEALQQAQQAIDGGDYGSATTTCLQLVNQFPGYASAHRLLGDAYREQGQPDDAERAFAAALARNPRHPGTSLGLGLIAEDKGANEAALAFCQVAWELAPHQTALREPLTRVSLRRYGSDGELQLTHAALAQLHARSSRLRRAISEYRLALAALPARTDLKVGLLEALWRLGSDDEALLLAREIVEQQPECAPALVVLADLEHRSGNNRRADEVLKQLRGVDPDGALVAEMLPLNARAAHQFLALAPAAVPFLDEDIVVAPERPKIAPAPDFDYRPMRTEIPRPDIAELAPMSIEEFGATSDEHAADVAPFSLDDLGDLPEGLEPISLEELGGLSDASDAGAGFDFGVPSFDTAPEAEAPAPFTLEEVLQFEAPAPVAEPASAPIEPDDQLVFNEPAPTSEPVIDDLASLAASLEVDVADALNRAGEPVADVEESRPPDISPRGYTTVLRGLEDEGFAPFDPRSREPIEGMPSMITDELPTFEEVAPAASAAPVADEPAVQTDEFGKITRDWDTIDDEILAAMPVEPGRGYTEELRSLDEIGLMPFEVEEDDAFEGVTPFNPFATDQLAPEPTAFSAPEPVQAVEPPPAAPIEEPAAPPADELLGGLEPFAFEEFDSGQPSADGQTRSFFGQSGWEGSASAVPSDADLDALLAFEDDEPVEEPAPDVAMPAAEAAPIAEDISLESAFQMPKAAAPQAEEPDPFAMPPSLSEADLNEFFESSIAVTRQLPSDAQSMDIDAWPAEPNQPATFEPAAFEPTPFRPEPFQPPAYESEPQVAQAEPSAPEPASPAPSLTSALRPNTEVFTRARAVKLGLMSEGRIGGTRELGEGITTEELVAMENRLKTRNLPEELGDSFDEDDDDDLLSATGATRDTRTLRAALEVTPDDDELRWWLAEALRDRGDLEDAYTEYRWLIRHAPHRHDQILEALNESVEHDQMPETAHRLLGDIYRRRGDVTRASSHAALALQVRRRVGRVL
jgi:tetratricopeptide (TPR) repeat protein